MTDEDYALLRRTCARMIRRWRCWKRWTEDEFVSWGWWGLECARRLYNPARGAWVAFAMAKIENAICDQIKQKRWHPQASGRRIPDVVYQLLHSHESLYDLTCKLSTRERQAVVWYYRDGATLSDIADAQQCTESNVSYVLLRARNRIRERLEVGR